MRSYRRVEVPENRSSIPGVGDDSDTEAPYADDPWGIWPLVLLALLIASLVEFVVVIL